jgi:hypothetical protein
MLHPMEGQLLEDTTRQSRGVQPKKRHKAFQSIRMVDRVDGRSYGKYSLDTMKSGHKDSKNTALTIPDRLAQTLRHATINNRNLGDATRHLDLSVDRRVIRPHVDHYWGGGTGVDPPEDTIMRLDPSADLNAVSTKRFQHGGDADEIVGTMMGAGQTVPVTSHDGSNLNSAVGLHYAVDIEPGKDVGVDAGIDPMLGRQAPQPTVGR